MEHKSDDRRPGIVFEPGREVSPPADRQRYPGQPARSEFAETKHLVFPSLTWPRRSALPTGPTWNRSVVALHFARRPARLKPIARGRSLTRVARPPGKVRSD